MDLVQFILSTLLMLAAAVILYLAARSLPRISDEPDEDKKSLLERWLISEMPHKIDLALNKYMGKFFRKMKVYILRLDNALSARLRKMNTDQNGNGRPKIDFNEITGDRSGNSGSEGDTLAEKR